MKRPLAAYFLLCFAITWGLAALLIFAGAPLAARFGPIDLRQPFWKAIFHAAVYAPAIAAFTVVGLSRGRAGLRTYVGRLLHWRVGVAWYAAVLLGMPLLHFGAVALANAVSGEAATLFAISPWYEVVPRFLLALVDDPGAVEELGWRGYALPLLQRRYSALGATLRLGAIWGIWHLPAFVIAAAPQSGFVFPVFLLGTVAASLLMTAVYNSTGGCVILMCLIHALSNFGYGSDAPPTATAMLVTAVLEIAVALGFIARFGVETIGRRKEVAPDLE